MTAQKSFTSITKMIICGNWLRHVDLFPPRRPKIFQDRANP